MFLYFADTVRDEEEVRPWLFFELIFSPFEWRSEIRPHVEGRGRQILQPVYVDLKDLLFACPKDDPVRFSFFLFGLENGCDRQSFGPDLFGSCHASRAVHGDQDRSMAFLDWISVTVGKEVLF